MNARRRLERLRGIATIFDARHHIATTALADAREIEDRARSDEQAAARRSAAAHEDWLSHVAREGFSPEYGEALAARIVTSDQLAKTAGAHLRVATASCASRRSDLQRAEGQVRSSEEAQTVAARSLKRKREEKQLTALADQVTARWCRR